MTTQLSEICDVGQLIYTMHPTAAWTARSSLEIVREFTSKSTFNNFRHT
jgi:hypothetical protein